MNRRALLLGFVAIALAVESSSAQGGKGGGANKPDSVTGISISAGASGPVVKWNTIDKATFQVQRSKSGDTCCNNSSVAGLTTNSWQDALLPSSGTYIYKVTATLNSGAVVGQAQYVYTAPAPVAPTTVTTTIAPPTLATEPILVQPAPAPAPATAILVAPTTTTATGMITKVTGSYRVTVTGVQVGRQTVDDPIDRDGKADEVYAASIIVRVDRTIGTRNPAPTFVKSREYGDVGTGQWPQRIRAGTALPSGGIIGGNAVPIGFVASSPSGSPSGETFPFTLWEGSLTDQGEAVVLIPSLWERDIDDVAFKNYTGNWLSNRTPLLESDYMKNQYTSNSLMATVGPSDAGTLATAAAGTTFTQPIYGIYAWPALSLTSPVDRPIGLSTYYGTLGYQERIIVLTREKLASLAVGATTDLSIPLIEAGVGTDGIYTMYVRIERIG